MRSRSNFRLGPDVVALLLPHRRPFLMVDAVEAYTRPTLRASRFVTANEPVFAGHFPGLHLWPGVLTIEGLGQSCNILHVLTSLEDAASQHGEDPADVLGSLLDLEREATLVGGRTARATRLLGVLAQDSRSRMGLGARVDVKLVRPVFAGQRIDYQVTHVLTVEGLGRFDVEASVNGELVATGTMTGALGPPVVG